MENKKMKKMQLKKIELINLNAQELNQLQGGSSVQCGAKILSLVAGGYDIGVDYSWWDCHTYDASVLPEVVVRP